MREVAVPRARITVSSHGLLIGTCIGIRLVLHDFSDKNLMGYGWRLVILIKAVTWWSLVFHVMYPMSRCYGSLDEAWGSSKY